MGGNVACVRRRLAAVRLFHHTLSLCAHLKRTTKPASPKSPFSHSLTLHTQRFYRALHYLCAAQQRESSRFSTVKVASGAAVTQQSPFWCTREWSWSPGLVCSQTKGLVLDCLDWGFLTKTSNNTVITQ